MPTVDDIEHRLEHGDSVNAIAADLGVTPRTIRNRLHAAGVPLASLRNRQRRLARLDDPIWLRHQYVDENRNASNIASELGVPTIEARRALDRFRIARPPDRPELTETALRQAFAGGGTVSSIARAAGAERATVRAAMRRHGIVNPNANRARRPAQLDNGDWLRARHLDRSTTVQQIADELGVAAITVRRALERHSLPPEPYVRPQAHLDESWLRQRFEVDLASASTIAAEAGVSVATVYRTTRRLGLTRSSSRIAGRPSGIDPTWLARRYVHDHQPMAQIAREADVGTSTVRRAMIAHGIDRRPRNSAAASMSQ